MKTGWICPRCNQVNSPELDLCKNCYVNQKLDKEVDSMQHSAIDPTSTVVENISNSVIVDIQKDVEYVPAEQQSSNQ